MQRSATRRATAPQKASGMVSDPILGVKLFDLNKPSRMKPRGGHCDDS
jgi:hypothetical protein